MLPKTQLFLYDVCGRVGGGDCREYSPHMHQERVMNKASGTTDINITDQKGPVWAPLLYLKVSSLIIRSS